MQTTALQQFPPLESVIHASGHLLDVYQRMVNKQVNAKAQFF
jgi:hypothetical protein